MDMKTCKDCYFFGEHSSECRIRSPKWHPNYRLGMWPKVELDDWCGEFIPTGEVYDDPLGKSKHGSR